MSSGHDSPLLAPGASRPFLGDCADCTCRSWEQPAPRGGLAFSGGQRLPAARHVPLLLVSEQGEGQGVCHRHAPRILRLSPALVGRGLGPVGPSTVPTPTPRSTPSKNMKDSLFNLYVSIKLLNIKAL